MEIIASVTFLAVANKAFVDYIAEPIRQKYPDIDLWWLMYVALVTGTLLGWFAVGDLFSDYVTDPTVSKALTALTVGGGTGIINKLFGKI